MKHFRSLVNNPAAIATMIALTASTAATFVQAQPDNMKITPSSPVGKILTKEKLDQVKRYILISGKRCTYANMYNNNPCIEVPGFWLYLNPDPGPNGHPQWNINCDTTRGDFNSLVVQEKNGASAFHTIEFLDANAIVIRGEGKTSEPVLNRAILETLRRIDLEAGSQGEPRK